MKFLHCAHWKFHYFYATKILREINLEDSWNSQITILTVLEEL